MGIREERLYYADSYLWHFDANILECVPSGGTWKVRLDASAFYPTSGGQPHDVGTLGGAAVRDVVIEDGHVYHIVDEPLEVGLRVHGVIDGQRRFDFMQQHCGQHILSRCLEDMMDIDTVGFHLGADWVTIDVDRADLSWADIERAEQRANEVIWENRRIEAQFVDPEQVGQFNLRRPPKVHEDIRIVSIEGFDDNACGGTHPSATGAVGAIKVVKAESLRGGLRLSFLCGGRALKDYQKRASVLREVGQALSSGVDDVLSGVQKLQSTASRFQKESEEAKDVLAIQTAERLVTGAEALSDGSILILHAAEGITSQNDVKRLGNALKSRLGDETRCLVGLLAEVEGRILVQLMVQGVGTAANTWLQDAVRPFGGKGGGNAQIAQGSVTVSENVGVNQVLSALKSAL